MIYFPREDSYLLAKQVKKYAKNKSVLDIGTGSGILASAALQSGASAVLASDINKEAVDEVKKQGIQSVQSNLFSKIKGRFDIIVFNPPYLPKDKREDKESARATTGGKKGDEIILRFLKQSKKHLNRKGFILLLTSSLTPKKRIESLIKTLSFSHKALASESLLFEKLHVWKIVQR